MPAPIHDFINKNKEIILKVGIVAVGVPLLVLLGMLLFTVGQFLVSLVLFIVVCFFLLGLAAMLWSYVEEYLAAKVSKNTSDIVESGKDDYRDLTNS
ncbi:MAG: hypothetical protein ACK5O1_02445 [Holosporales bacterium]|jgi:predicted PurR-regulated permease PerM